MEGHQPVSVDGYDLYCRLTLDDKMALRTLIEQKLYEPGLDLYDPASVLTAVDDVLSDLGVLSTLDELG